MKIGEKKKSELKNVLNQIVRFVEMENWLAMRTTKECI